MFIFDAILLGIVHLIWPDEPNVQKTSADDAMTYIILDELEEDTRDTDFQEFKSDYESNDNYESHDNYEGHEHHEGCEW